MYSEIFFLSKGLVFEGFFLFFFFLIFKMKGVSLNRYKYYVVFKLSIHKLDRPISVKQLPAAPQRPKSRPNSTGLFLGAGWKHLPVNGKEFTSAYHPHELTSGLSHPRNYPCLPPWWPSFFPRDRGLWKLLPSEHTLLVWTPILTLSLMPAILRLFLTIRTLTHSMLR